MLGILRTAKAEYTGPEPSKAAATLSRTSPATLEIAVAAPKTAVDVARRRVSAMSEGV